MNERKINPRNLPHAALIELAGSDSEISQELARRYDDLRNSYFSAVLTLQTFKTYLAEKTKNLPARGASTCALHADRQAGM